MFIDYEGCEFRGGRTRLEERVLQRPSVSKRGFANLFGRKILNSKEETAHEEVRRFVSNE
jgi:hypothetical protein